MAITRTKLRENGRDRAIRAYLQAIFPNIAPPPNYLESLVDAVVDGVLEDLEDVKADEVPPVKPANRLLGGYPSREAWPAAWGPGPERQIRIVAGAEVEDEVRLKSAIAPLDVDLAIRYAYFGFLFDGSRGLDYQRIAGDFSAWTVASAHGWVGHIDDDVPEKLGWRDRELVCYLALTGQLFPNFMAGPKLGAINTLGNPRALVSVREMTLSEYLAALAKDLEENPHGKPSWA